MSSTVHAWPLVRRIVAEHRRVVWPLIIGLAINIVVYAAFVLPLSTRVANIEERDRIAEHALAAAQLDHARASGTVTGKDQAAKELESFYTEVLPRDLTGARRLTHLRLAQMAREADLRMLRATATPNNEPDSDLTRLKIEMELTGTYANMREFLHQLETASEFVVIDNVELADGGTSGGTLDVRLELSTYYRESSS